MEKPYELKIGFLTGVHPNRHLMDTWVVPHNSNLPGEGEFIGFKKDGDDWNTLFVIVGVEWKGPFDISYEVEEYKP